jgi:hypothetical protein
MPKEKGMFFFPMRPELGDEPGAIPEPGLIQECEPWKKASSLSFGDGSRESYANVMDGLLESCCVARSLVCI